MSLRASFTDEDPTLRLILSVIGVTATPHHRFGAFGGHALHHNDGTQFGTYLGTYDANGLWKVITERKPGQTILDAIKAAAQISEAA